MPWVRLDDHFDQNLKVAAVGPLGIALWVTGLAYCNRNLTDGFIPWNVAKSLLSWEYLEPPDEQGRRKVQRLSVSSGMVGDDVTSESVIDLLVSAGLWDFVDDRGGFVIHDYADFQPTRADVEAERAAKQAAGKAGGQASALARAQARGSAPATADAQAKSKPVPVPITSKEAIEGAGAPKPLKAPLKSVPTEEWASEMREKYRLRDFDETLKFHMNGSYYRGCADKCGYLEGKLKAASERERGMNPTANQPVGQNVMAIHERNLELQRIAIERKAKLEVQP